MELYVHIPFCVKKCAYCDFLSAPCKGDEKKRYLDALCKEIYASKTNQRVTSIFFGGGTPSLYRAKELEQILQAIRGSFVVDSDAEITLEANPGTVTKESLYGYRQAGFNRISFGLQSADASELKAIGRIHTKKQFEESFLLAREAGFQNINVDLMTGLPSQNLSNLRETLNYVLSLEPEHISAYSLILEEGTKLFKDVEEGRVELPDEDTVYQLDSYMIDALEQADYHRYEISNYAKKGQECKHNIGYWTGVPYLGFGLGASSYYEGKRFSNETELETYLRYAAELDKIRCNIIEVTKKEQMEEFMFLGLRMIQGISIEEFKVQFGCSLWDVYGAMIEKHKNNGLLCIEENRIFLSKRGLEVANMVMQDFIFDSNY